MANGNLYFRNEQADQQTEKIKQTRKDKLNRAARNIGLFLNSLLNILIYDDK